MVRTKFVGGSKPPTRMEALDDLLKGLIRWNDDMSARPWFCESAEFKGDWAEVLSERKGLDPELIFKSLMTGKNPGVDALRVNTDSEGTAWLRNSLPTIIDYLQEHRSNHRTDLWVGGLGALFGLVSCLVLLLVFTAK